MRTAGSFESEQSKKEVENNPNKAKGTAKVLGMQHNLIMFKSKMKSSFGNENFDRSPWDVHIPQ